MHISLAQHFPCVAVCLSGYVVSPPSLFHANAYHRCPVRINFMDARLTHSYSYSHPLKLLKGSIFSHMLSFLNKYSLWNGNHPLALQIIFKCRSSAFIYHLNSCLQFPSAQRKYLLGCHAITLNLVYSYWTNLSLSPIIPCFSQLLSFCQEHSIMLDT